jgi:DNA-binding MarR family transcriptional regulator
MYGYALSVSRPKVDADRDQGERALVDGLTAFFAAVRRARGRAAHVEEGLSLAQYQLLVGLREVPSLTVGELGAAGSVAQPTATRMLALLERRAVVVRARDERDGRRVCVRLTDAGREALEAKHAEIEAAKRKVAAQFTPAERARAAALLERLARVIDEET